MQDGIALCVCVCVRACANKYLLTSPHEENVRFVCELTARPHTLPLSINYNKQKRFPHSCTYDKTCPLKPALIRNHRPASSCLLQHLKCNYSGFLRVVIIARKLHCPLSCSLKTCNMWINMFAEMCIWTWQRYFMDFTLNEWLTKGMVNMRGYYKL